MQGWKTVHNEEYDTDGLSPSGRYVSNEAIGVAHSSSINDVAVCCVRGVGSGARPGRCRIPESFFDESPPLLHLCKNGVCMHWAGMADGGWEDLSGERAVVSPVHAA